MKPTPSTASYNYHGTFYTRRYYNFIIEITADSPEEANAKAREYLKNKANHDSIVSDSEVNQGNDDRMDRLKWCFQENAEVDSAYILDEDGDEDDEIDVPTMSICKI